MGLLNNIILTGKDAKRFDDAVNNVKLVTKKEYKQSIKDYEFIKKLEELKNESKDRIKYYK